MAIDYVLEENKVRPGTYYIRVVPKATRRQEEITTDIAQKSLVQPSDIEAVLNVLDDEIVDALIEGYSVIVDGFLGFSLSVNLKREITDPNYTIDPEDIDVSVNVSVKPQIVRRVRDRLRTTGDFRKISVPPRSPQPLAVYDVKSQTLGQYTPDGPIEISGSFLDLPDDFNADTRNGVFFSFNGTESRATLYMRDGNKQIVCLVPPTVSGTVDIIVRTDYGGPNLREGRLSAVPQAAT